MIFQSDTAMCSLEHVAPWHLLVATVSTLVECVTSACRFSLEDNEHVTAMKVMLLRSLETMSGRKEYIVMGTTYICSEDTSNVGKVLLIHIYTPKICL